jgi:hypothetical protein
MIYTFRAENQSDADTAVAIALDTDPRTIDAWTEGGVFWLKVWTGDRTLPQKLRPYASLEFREF